MDILSIGEALIDFIPEGKPGVYIRNFGGAPANLAIVATRVGAKAGFIGKVGADLFGDFLSDRLKKEHVDVSGLTFTEHACTTLSFVHLDENGERTFQFIRKPGADMLLESKDICPKLIAKSKIVHFGSAQLMLPAARVAYDKVIKLAKKHGGIISFDPNYRPAQWPNEHEARKHILTFMRQAHMIKVSEEEVLWLTGETDLNVAAANLPRQMNSLLVISCGEAGARYYYGGIIGLVTGFSRKPIDTTGAGDAFWGAVLARLCLWVQGSGLNGWLNEERIRQALLYGNASGAICVASKGAISERLSLAIVQEMIR